MKCTCMASLSLLLQTDMRVMPTWAPPLRHLRSLTHNKTAERQIRTPSLLPRKAAGHMSKHQQQDPLCPYRLQGPPAHPLELEQLGAEPQAHCLKRCRPMIKTSVEQHLLKMAQTGRKCWRAARPG